MSAIEQLHERLCEKLSEIGAICAEYVVNKMPNSFVLTPVSYLPFMRHLNNLQRKRIAYLLGSRQPSAFATIDELAFIHEPFPGPRHWTP